MADLEKKIVIPVEANTSPADKKIDKFKKDTSKHSVEIPVEIDLSDIKKAMHSIEGMIGKISSAFDKDVKFSGLQKGLDDVYGKIDKIIKETKNGTYYINVNPLGFEETKKQISSMTRNIELLNGSKIDLDSFNRLADVLENIETLVNSIVKGMNFDNIRPSTQVQEDIESTTEQLEKLAKTEEKIKKIEKYLNNTGIKQGRNVIEWGDSEEVSEITLKNIIKAMKEYISLGGDLSKITFKAFNVETETKELYSLIDVLEILEDEGKVDIIDESKMSNDYSTIKKLRNELTELNKELTNAKNRENRDLNVSLDTKSIEEFTASITEAFKKIENLNINIPEGFTFDGLSTENLDKILNKFDEMVVSIKGISDILSTGVDTSKLKNIEVNVEPKVDASEFIKKIEEKLKGTVVEVKTNISEEETKTNEPVLVDDSVISKTQTTLKFVANTFGADLSSAIAGVEDDLKSLNGKIDFSELFSSLRENLLEIVKQFQNSLESVNFSSSQLDDLYKTIKGWNDADSYSANKAGKISGERGAFINLKTGQTSNAFLTDNEGSFGNILFNALKELSVGIDGEISSIYDAWIHSHPFRKTIEGLKAIGSDTGFSVADLDVGIGKALKEKIPNMLSTHNYKYTKLDLSGVAEADAKRLLEEYRKELLNAGLRQDSNGKMFFPTSLAKEGARFNSDRKTEILNGAMRKALSNVGLETSRLTSGNIEDLKVDLSALQQEEQNVSEEAQELIEVFRKLGNVLDGFSGESFNFGISEESLDGIISKLNEIVDLLKVVGKIDDVNIDTGKNVNSSGTLSQKFDNDMQRNLVYLENYKNTIAEIDRLKLEPETDETIQKMKELNSLADYYVSQISLLRSENHGSISVAGMKDMWGMFAPGLASEYTNSQLEEFYKLGQEKSGLKFGLDVPNFTVIGDEIVSIESKSEGLRVSLEKNLMDSQKYVEGLRRKFITLTETMDDLKTETSPKWIETLNKEIDKILSKYPELEQFKDKFTADQAKEFIKTDSWNEFLATLPQAQKYLEYIGYEQKNAGTKIKIIPDIDIVNIVSDIQAALNSEAVKVHVEPDIDTANFVSEVQSVLNKESIRVQITPDISSNNSGLTDVGTTGMAHESALANELREKVESVTTAVDLKTRAFQEEEQIVVGTVQREVTNLEVLDGQLLEIINTIEKIKTAFNELDFSSLTSSSIDNGLDNMLSNLGTQLQGLDIEALSRLSDVLSGLNIPADASNNLVRVATALGELKNRFAEIGVGENGFLSSINAILSKTDELQNLLKILESSERKIKRAGDAANAGNGTGSVNKDEVLESIRKKKEELAECDSYAEDLKKDLNELSEAEKNTKVGLNRYLSDKQSEMVRNIITSRTFKDYNPSDSKSGLEKWFGRGKLDSISKEAMASYKGWNEELVKAGYYLGEIKETTLGLEADILPIDGCAIKNAEEFRNKLSGIVTMEDFLISGVEKFENKVLGLRNEISSLEASIAPDLNAGGVQKDTEAMSTAVNALKKDIESLQGALKKSFKDDGFSTLKFIDSLEDISKRYKSLKAINDSDPEKVTDANMQSLTAYFRTFKDTIGKMSLDSIRTDNKTPEFIAQLDKVKNQLEEVKVVLDKVEAGEAFTDEDIAKIKQFVAQFRELNKASKDRSNNFTNTSKVQGALGQIAEILSKNTAMSKELRQEFEALQAEMKAFGGNIPIDIFTEFGYRLETLKTQMKEGKTGLSFFDGIAKKAKSMSQNFLGMYLSLYDVVRYVRTGITHIRDLDTALTEMRKVSDESVSSLKNFQNISFDIAGSVGTTAKQIQNSTADFMRIGESLNEAADSAKVSNILLNVSEFESIDEATNSLVAMSAAYNELDKIEIVDKLNNIGNNFAISTDGLATALQKSASALKTAGNDMDEAIALVTAGNQVVQDPDSVGAGLRTIALRITGTEAAKQELESLGEDTSDFLVQTSAKSQQAIKDFTKVASNNFKGFDILDDNGNFKSTYEILSGISEIYDEIVETDKQYGSNMANGLLETLAGKNRANIAASILQNPDILKSVYESSQDSDGSAQKELDSYLDSIEGKISRFQNELQEFWYNLISSETIKTIVDVGTTTLDVINSIVSGLNELGAVGKIAKTAIVGALGLGISNFVSGHESKKDILKDISNTLKGKNTAPNNVANATSSAINKAAIDAETDALERNKNAQLENDAAKAASVAGDNAKTASTATETAAVKANTEIQEENTRSDIAGAASEGVQASATGASTAAEIADSTATAANTVATSANTTSIWANVAAIKAWLASNPIGWIMLAVGGLITLTGVVKAFTKSTEEIIEAGEKAGSTIKTLRDDFANTEETVSSISERFAELAQGVDMISGRNISLSMEDYEEFLDLSNQLADLFPTLSRNYTENGDAIVQLSGDTNTMVSSLEALVEAEKQLANQKIAAELPDLYKGVVESSKNYGTTLGELETELEAYENQIGEITDGVNQNLIDKLFSGDTYELKADSLKAAEEILNVYRDAFKKAGLDLEWYDIAAANGQAASLFEIDQDGNVIESNQFDGYGIKISNYTNIDEDDLSEAKDKLAGAFSDVAETYEDEASALNSKINATTKESEANYNSLISGIMSWLSTDSTYSVMSDELQGITRALINNLNFDEVIEKCGSDWNKVEDFLSTDIIDKIAESTNKDAILEAWNDLFTADLSSMSVFDAREVINKNIDILSKEFGMSRLDLKLQLGFDKYDIFFKGEDNLSESLYEKAQKVLTGSDKGKVGTLTLEDMKIAANLSLEFDENSLSYDELLDNIDVYKYLGKDGFVNSGEILKDLGIKYIVEPEFEIKRVGDISSLTQIIDPLVKDSFKSSLNLLDDSLVLESDFIGNVDSYISDANKLKVALAKINDGSWSDNDFTELAESFEVLKDESDNLQPAIVNLLNSMESDMIAEFAEQFGKVDSREDRVELEKFMVSVLKLGDVVGNTAFSIDIATESESFSSLATAMGKSVSATGLSAESVENLKNRYSELEALGYDVESMFETTENGIHLNRKALNELEDAYESVGTAQIQARLQYLKGEYDNVTDAIANCTDAASLASLYLERDSYANKIRELGMLASQYDGLYSAYNKWQTEQNAGNERDMYEGIISGFDEVKDEMSRGWFDDDTVAFLELLSGENISTLPIQEQIQAYENLSKTIEGTKYSVKDFFTTDSDGNSTAEGVFNFLNAIDDVEDRLGSDLVEITEDGSILGFDFANAIFNEDGIEYAGNAAIAKILGISEEAVNILVRAADDAGFVVNLEGVYTQFATMREGAEAAAIALRDLNAAGKKGTDHVFNFNVTDIQSVTSELEAAKEVLDQFRSEDGSLDTSIPGAKEAQEVAFYYTTLLDKLTQPAYMDLNVDDVDAELRGSLELLQEYDELLGKERNFGVTYTSEEELESYQNRMNEIIKEISKDAELKAQLKIDENATEEEIKAMLDSGTLEFPGTVDLEIKMGKSLEDISTLLQYQSGLINEIDMKLQLGIELTDEEKLKQQIDELSSGEFVAIEAKVEGQEELQTIQTLKDEDGEVTFHAAIDGEWQQLEKIVNEDGTYEFKVIPKVEEAEIPESADKLSEMVENAKTLGDKFGEVSESSDKWNNLVENAKNLGDNFVNVAKALGLSEEEINSLLSKAKEFEEPIEKPIELTNFEKVQQAVAELGHGEFIAIEAEVKGEGLKAIQVLKNSDGTITYKSEVDGEFKELIPLLKKDGSLQFGIKPEIENDTLWSFIKGLFTKDKEETVEVPVEPKIVETQDYNKWFVLERGQTLSVPIEVEGEGIQTVQAIMDNNGNITFKTEIDGETKLLELFEGENGLFCRIVAEDEVTPAVEEINNETQLEDKESTLTVDDQATPKIEEVNEEKLEDKESTITTTYTTDGTPTSAPATQTVETKTVLSEEDPGGWYNLLGQANKLIVTAEFEGEEIQTLTELAKENGKYTFETEVTGDTELLEEGTDKTIPLLLKAKDEVTPVIDELMAAEVKDKIVELVGEDNATPIIDAWNILSADPKFTELSAEDQATLVVDAWNEIIAVDKEATVTGIVTATDETQAATDSANENIESIDKEPTSTIKAIDLASAIVESVVTYMDSINGKRTDTYIYTHKVTTNETQGASASGTAHSSGTFKVPYFAHADGTAMSMWRGYRSSIGAYAQGNDWRLPRDESALVNEVGTESIVRDGKWFTLPGGAHVEQLKRGDIIFNAKQTEELIKTGKVTSGGGHGRVAYANGTAFNTMNAYYGSSGKGGTGLKWGTISGSVSKNSSSGSSNFNNSNNNNNNSSSDAEEFKETLDWIEVKIAEIERQIENLDQTASATYKSWKDRNKALVSEMSKVTEEIKVQKAAYARYMEEADSVGLSEDYKKLVQEGKIDIEKITNESLANQIQEYTDWYNKAIECYDATEDLKDSLAELARQKFDNVAKQYEDKLSAIEHEANVIDALISKTETSGHIVSTKYYDELIKQEKKANSLLQKEYSALQEELAKAMETGDIQKGSEEWYAMQAEINAVQEAIIKSDTSIIEFNNNIRQLKWDSFDRLQEQISNVATEADFLIGLMEDSKLYDDNGQLTDTGMATMGLHGQNYNTYMAQADKYAKEMKEIDKDLAKDPGNQDLIKRRQELLELQRDSINAANDEKMAIRDMVEEGINIELEALQERIDKYKEAQDEAKSLYDYQKNISDQVKEISSLEKQMTAYQGDNSEENKQRVQQLKVQLEEARENLEETEMDHALEESQKMLDKLYEDYEEILNERLDNIDMLLEDMIDKINANSSDICNTLSEEADKVGYTLSESMRNIWSNEGDAAVIISKYGDDFCSQITSVNNVLNAIAEHMGVMLKQEDKDAKNNIKENQDKPVDNPKKEDPPKEDPPKEEDTPKKEDTSKTIKVGGKINAGSAQIYDYAGDKSGERQYFRNDPIYTVLKESGDWIQVRHHKANSGIDGWFKKSDVKAYKTGGLVDKTGLAWLDGTKGKPEMVLNAQDTKNLIELTDTLRKLSDADISSMMSNVPMFDSLTPIAPSFVPNNMAQSMNNTFHMTFELHDVTNGEQVINYLIKSDRFENAVKAMTVDRLAGGSKFSKSKYVK